MPEGLGDAGRTGKHRGADEVPGFVSPLAVLAGYVEGFDFHSQPDALDVAAVNGHKRVWRSKKRDDVGSCSEQFRREKAEAHSWGDTHHR